jgi:predicted ATPase
MFIGFLPFTGKELGSEEEYERINRSLFQYLKNSNSEGFIQAKEMPPFFTLQPTYQDYRTLVESMGLRGSKAVLKSINDLVQFKNEEPKWFTQAIESKVFQLGFMRNSEPFFAFHNAGSVLAGVKYEDLSAISNDLELSFKLEGFSENHKLRLKFDSKSLIPRRIAVLIGKNGLGKSETLKAFCRGALRHRVKDLELVESNGKRPLISRIIAMATPGETSNTFPQERQKTQKLHYRRLNLTRKGTHSIASALVQLARSEDSIGERKRWDLFIDTVTNVLPVENIYIKLKNDNFIALTELREPGGEQQALEVWGSVREGSDPVFKINKTNPLSSGQLTFFKFALMCCLHIENGSFVLMDEPETHMHPNMISDFVGLLDEILEFTGSYAILSTHSVFLVREVSREQVHIFKEEENYNISITQPRLRTFGADVDSISQFVFEEDIESKLTDKIYEKVKNRTFESVDDELGDELSLAALMDLQSRLDS